MFWLLVLGFAALIAGLVYHLSRRGQVGRTAAGKPVVVPAGLTDRHFWGKQFVVPDPAQACRSARELDGQCFAFGKVPPLPLKDCGKFSCACRFQDLIDQRATLNRRHRTERRDQIRFEDRKDRRTGSKRRESDQNNWYLSQ
jgi:hypothetical protein